jgi:hypothetical protein
VPSEKCDLRGMKRGTKDMERNFKDLSNRVKRIAKTGINVSALQTKLNALQVILTDLKGITNCEGMQIMQDKQQEFYETVRDANDEIQKFEQHSQLPRIMKQANRELKNLQRQSKNLLSKATRSKINLTAIFDSINTDINKLAEYLSAAQVAYKSGNPEDAYSSIQEDFYGGIGDVRDVLNRVQSVLNLSQFVKGAKRSITSIEREVKISKRRGIDTTNLEAIVAEGKEWLITVQNLLQQGITNTNIDDAFALMEEGQNLRQRYEEEKQDVLINAQGNGNEIKPPPFLKQFLPRLQIPTNLLKALVKPE